MNRSRIIIIRIALLPFTLIYWLVISFRNLLFVIRILPETKFDLPVISIGNITVGGTGKTPHIEYLVELLVGNKYRPAVLSRGYKRKTRDFQLVNINSRVSQVGDEPKQLKNKYPGLIVATDRKRVHGIKQLLTLNQTPDLILLDDAFQHRYVKPGISIVLMDYSRLITDDYLLPAGRLREPASSLKRADIILVTKSSDRITPGERENTAKKIKIDKHQKLYFTGVAYKEIQPVFENVAQMSLEEIKSNQCAILLLTGIANPAHLRTFAGTISSEIFEMRFPDHYSYTTRDVEKIRKRLEDISGHDAVILTTEKDAMRLKELEPGDELRKKMFYVPIKISFIDNQHEEFDHIILEYVRENK